MDDNTTKLSATAVIWTAFAVILIGAFVTLSSYGWVPILAVIILMTLAALGGTPMVWKRYAMPVEETEKAKRRSRVERVLNDMDEHELEELRARLMREQGGEMVSLDEVLSRSKGRVK